MLTIVIPTRNRRALLVESLRALGRQDSPSPLFEVVVVSDGSTDDTVRAVAALVREPPWDEHRLRCAEQDPAGASAARNHGLRLARGKLVLFLDDDVAPGTGLVAAHLDAHARGPATGTVVLGRLELEYGRGALRRELERWWAGHYDRLAETPPSFADVFTANVSVPREDALAAGGLDETIDYGEDVEFGYRLKKLGLELAFAPRAVGRARNTKTVRELFRDQLREGRGSVQTYRKHPATLGETALGRFREPNRKMRLARAALLAASTTPGADRLIDFGFTRWGESGSTGWLSRTMFDLSRSYYFWNGVRAEADPREWRELRSSTPTRPSL